MESIFIVAVHKDYSDSMIKLEKLGTVSLNYITLSSLYCTQDSARQIAADNIKEQLSKLLEKRKLIIGKYLICSQLQKLWKNIREVRNLSFDDLYDWVKDTLSKSRDECEGTLRGYLYNGVELFDVEKLLDAIVFNNYDYYECILPKSDISTKTDSWAVWAVYSKERLEEYTKSFFAFAQNSFIDICDSNFNALKNNMPDYYNMPYKYCIEIETEKLNYEQPILNYYYIATSLSDLEPVVTFCDVRKKHKEISKIIKDSYMQRSININHFSIHGTIISKILTSIEYNSTPLIDFVFDKIKSNLEHIWGNL